jgi:hypothetical protein
MWYHRVCGSRGTKSFKALQQTSGRLELRSDTFLHAQQNTAVHVSNLRQSDWFKLKL